MKKHIEAIQAATKDLKNDNDFAELKSMIGKVYCDLEDLEEEVNKIVGSDYWTHGEDAIWFYVIPNDSSNNEYQLAYDLSHDPNGMEIKITGVTLCK